MLKYEKKNQQERHIFLLVGSPCVRHLLPVASQLMGPSQGFIVIFRLYLTKAY